MPGLSLRRCVRLDFPSTPAAADAAEPALTAERERYHRDLVRPYGLDLDSGVLERPGPSYGEMGRALLDRAVSAQERVDLLVLAYAVPDLDPGRATATYLSHLCPGRPVAFAVSDQGSAAAFTGLKLIGEHARAGNARRAVLLVVEQPTLPYDPGLPVRLPSGHGGVALVLDADASSSSVLRLGSVTIEPGRPGVPPAPESGSTTVLGAGLAPAEGDQRPYTGAWWQLAELTTREAKHESRDPEPERVVVADWEPATGTLCRAEFRTLA